MEFTVVSEYEIQTLIKKVNELIKEGWRPQGGIDTSAASGFHYIALTRETKKE
jgi:hypothetical protein